MEPSKTKYQQIPAFYFEPDYLDSLVGPQSQSYNLSTPFPHMVIDNFLPEEIVKGILDEFPNDEDFKKWYLTNNQSRNFKSSSEKDRHLGALTRHVVHVLNSSDFIRFLEKSTGISGLIPDPHIFGGGYHRTTNGGFLKIHADNNWDTKLLLYRRLNLILFLNNDWKKEYGGELELWNNNMTKCEKSIEPIFNRAVIFYNSDISFHGHPDPLNGSEHFSRKSLALYYYTATRPKNEINKLPHTTQYKARPGEIFRRRKAGIRVLQRFIPPVFDDLYNYITRKKLINDVETK